LAFVLLEKQREENEFENNGNIHRMNLKLVIVFESKFDVQVNIFVSGLTGRLRTFE
jgi:hypothetical protein